MNLELLGNNISGWRRHRGFSQVVFAEKVGITKYLLLKIEKGYTAPTIDVLTKMGNVLEVPMEVLLENT